MSEVFDILEGRFLQEDEKLHAKAEIFTGHGSAYEVQIGKCEKLLKGLKDNSIHTIITDPPYGVGMSKEWDKDMPTIDVWNECYRVLKPGSHIAIFCQPSKVPELMARLGATDFEYRDQLIWCYQGTHLKGVQTNDEAYGSKIRNTYNPILLYRKKLVDSELHNWGLFNTNFLNLEDTRQKYKGDHSSIIKKFEDTGEMHYQSSKKSNTFSELDSKGWVPNARGSIASNVQYCPRATKDERTCNGNIDNTHVSVKPVALMLWLVKLLTNSPNQKVLDPYTGSGSTGIACRKANRKFLGFEMSEKWAEVAKTRIKYTFDLHGKYFDKIRPV